MAAARLTLTGLAVVLLPFMSGWVAFLGVTLSAQDVALGMMFLVGTFFGIMASWAWRIST